MDKLEGQNTGLIIEAPRPLDYVYGAETGIPEKLIINVSGDWTKHLPTNERQKLSGFDVLACVSFSAANVLEILFNYHLKNKLFTLQQERFLKLAGYIDKEGNVNFSDRFIAKVSGTTKNGNSLWRVWDAIRAHGLVPENEWPFTKQQTDWESYYAEIPDSVKARGTQFKAFFDIRYEWAIITPQPASIDIFKKLLQYSPIQVATAVCRPWDIAEPIQACGLGAGHATTIYGTTETYEVYDHYNPFRKKFAADYIIPYAIKAAILPVEKKETPAPAKYEFKKKLSFGERSDEIVKLQDALKSAGCFPLPVISTGYYGETTRQAVMAYQKKFSIASPEVIAEINGMYIGEETRKRLSAGA